MAERELDIVLFGATGFTGGLTAEYLARHAPARLRWAIAGRNLAKLEKVRESLAAIDPRLEAMELVVADAADQAELEKVVSRGKVVITTVGPYVELGEPLVAACAATGTDYVDLTGEPEFVDQMWLRHHATAAANGTRLVHSCGFDSIPHDIGVFHAMQHVDSSVPVTIRGVVRSNATFSGGTFHSALGAFSRARQMKAAHSERRRKEAKPVGRSSRAVAAKPGRDPLLGYYLLPLPTIDPQVVVRSGAALASYGPEFRYSHFAGTKTLRYAVGGSVGAGALALGAQVGPLRNLLKSKVPQGEGPSPERRRRSWFTVDFVVEADGRTTHTRVSGGDPGYTETAKMLAESALCLAFDTNPVTSGQVTTAAAMGQNLLTRLQAAGMTFEVLTPDRRGRPDRCRGRPDGGSGRAGVFSTGVVGGFEQRLDVGRADGPAGHAEHASDGEAHQHLTHAFDVCLVVRRELGETGGEQWTGDRVGEHFTDRRLEVQHRAQVGPLQRDRRALADVAAGGAHLDRVLAGLDRPAVPGEPLRHSMQRYVDTHHPALPGGELHHGNPCQLTGRTGDLGGMLADVDLHDLTARHGTGVGDRHLHHQPVGTSLHDQVGVVEARVGKPVPEGEGHREVAGVVPAVADEDSLAVTNTAALAREVEEGGRVGQPHWHGLGQSAGRVDPPGEHVGDGAAARLTEQRGLQQGRQPVGEGQGDHAAGGEHHDGVGLCGEHGGEQIDLFDGQVEGGAVEALGLRLGGSPRKSTATSAAAAAADAAAGSSPVKVRSGWKRRSSSSAESSRVGLIRELPAP